MAASTDCQPRSPEAGQASWIYLVMAEARRSGLLHGPRTEHLGFRAPKALIEAASRASGMTSPTELCLLGLTLLAQLGADPGVED
ncbi:MAG TPA: hypothetical protein VGM87_07665 [Roseomonas sp.]